MTVSSSTDRATFAGNGTTTAFPLPFRFFANSDIRAWLVANATGVLTPLTLGVHYTLTGAGDPEVAGSATGRLTMTTPPTSEQSLFVLRAIPLTQPTDIVNQGHFFPEAHEAVFDRLTMLIQQAAGESKGAIRAAIGDPEPARLPNAISRANLLQSFDSLGNPVAVAPASGSATDLALSLANATDPAKGAGQIGFSQSGTGVVPRTALSKLREIVSVKDFGAVGDNVADDTVAFELALASGANYITMPPGVYLITRTLALSGNKTLVGAIGGTQAFQSARINHSATSTGPLFSLTTIENGGFCLKNFSVIGGNGSFCIVSNRPYIHFDYIHMEPYNGGGIQLLSSGGGGSGSSSSKISNCQWVGPAGASPYKGFDIDVNGGDVLLDSCTAIRGAIGIEVRMGQTITLNRCSVNKQTRNPNVSGGAGSSAAQFDTAGIKLSGTGSKEAISIRNCYIEACDNGVLVEQCKSLNIESCLFQDSGAAGNSGAWTAVGNAAITLSSSLANNVTIMNNRFIQLSNGTVADPFFGLRFNSAQNVLYLNNYFEFSGDNSGEYNIGETTKVFRLGNTKVVNTASPVASVDASGNMRDIVSADQSAWVTPTLTAPWTHETGNNVRYKKDALGFVTVQGRANGGAAGNALFTLPVGLRPSENQSFAVNASEASGIVTVFTDGVVSFRAGTGTFVYLSAIRFSLSFT